MFLDMNLNNKDKDKKDKKKTSKKSLFKKKKLGKRMLSLELEDFNTKKKELDDTEEYWPSNTNNLLEKHSPAHLLTQDSNFEIIPELDLEYEITRNIKDALDQDGFDSSEDSSIYSVYEFEDLILTKIVEQTELSTTFQGHPENIETEKLCIKITEIEEPGEIIGE